MENNLKSSNVNDKQMASCDKFPQTAKQYLPDVVFCVRLIIASVILGVVGFVGYVLILLMMWFYIILEMYIAEFFITGASGITVLSYFAKIIFQKQLKEKITNKFIKRNLYPISKKVKIIEFIVIFLIGTSVITYSIREINTYAHTSLREFASGISARLQKEEIEYPDLYNNFSNDNEETNEHITYNQNMEFILIKNKIEIPNSLYKCVYLQNVQFNNATDYADSIFNTKENSYNENKLGVSVQKLENNFYGAVEAAKQYSSVYGQNDEWYQRLPSEEELLYLIKEAELFSNNYANFFVYNRISNYYQKLALEYIRQDDDKDIAKYYYMKSIEFDYMSIRYADNEYDYNIAIERLRERYNDIYSYCLTEKNTYERSRILRICDTVE